MKSCLKVEDIVFIGIRDIESGEQKTLIDNNIKCFTPDHIEELGGIGNVIKQSLEYLDPGNKGFPIHVSLDIDGVDPSIAPGTGTKSKGGLTYREIHYIMRKLHASGRFNSMDLVEINPLLEPS